MNNHIKEACKQYITQDVNPEYALMLNGAWGCGKTYFINELQKESWLSNMDDQDEKKVVKISLYGVTSKEDIDTQLFYAIHKNLNNKFVKSTGKIIESFLGGKYSIDGKTAMSMCFKDWSTKVKVIIVDDLERSSMSIHEVIGYFYNYIIDQNIRIIIIGNENEIKNSAGDLDEHYMRTKEKVIGETYTIHPQIEEAIKTFLSLERKIEIPLSTDTAIEICLKVVKSLEIQNLRNVWQGLVQVQRLLNAVADTYAYQNVKYESSDYDHGESTKEDYIKGIFELYLVLYLQLARGDIDKNQVSREEKSIIADVLSIYKKEEISLKAFEGKEKRKKNNKTDGNNGASSWMRRKYLGFIPLQSSEGDESRVWVDYLFHSKIDKELLNKCVEADKQWFIPTRNENDLKSNLYILVSRSLEIEQEEFEKYYNETLCEFKSGKYDNVGELIQGYSLCLTYKKYGARKYEDGEIKKLFEDIIQITDIKVTLDGDYGHIFSRGSMGYSYSTDMTIGEGKEFVDKMRDIVKEKQKVDIKKAFVQEFDSISCNEEFMTWVNLLYSNTLRNYHIYYSQPVFSWIDSGKLYNNLLSLSFNNQFNFMEALKERYGMKYANGKFERNHYPDFEVLLLLEKQYNSRIDGLEVGQIERYRLIIILDKLKEVVVYCRKSIMEENSQSVDN